MGSIHHIHTNFATTSLSRGGSASLLGISPLPFSTRVTVRKEITTRFPCKRSYNSIVKKPSITIPRSSNSSASGGDNDDSPDKPKKSFGNSRKDVILIGVGVTVAGFALESGLEYFGVDPLQAGNVVQLVLVLGLTLGWISTYIFRVSNKEMTYVQQLRDYEDKVMQKRLEGLSEAELEVLLEQVEEDKRRLASGKKIN